VDLTCPQLRCGHRSAGIVLDSRFLDNPPFFGRLTRRGSLSIPFSNREWMVRSRLASLHLVRRFD